MGQREYLIVSAPKINTHHFSFVAQPLALHAQKSDPSTAPAPALPPPPTAPPRQLVSSATVMGCYM
ncbi:hypothetical protein ACS0TY_034392 [Phlomoides rotata]